MRLNKSILACALFAFACCAAPAQTAVMQRTNSVSPFAFNYDAAHDQITASGISIQPLHTTPPAAPTPTTGTIVVYINIKVVSSFVSSDHIDCSLLAIGGDIDLAAGTVDGGMETANAHARPWGSRGAGCKLVIPYSWTLSPSPAAPNGLILVFGAADKCDDGMVMRSTLQVDGPESLPKNGGTAEYSFDVEL